MMDIVTITGYTLVAALIGGGVGYLLGDQHRAKRDAVEIWAMRQQRDESRAQRDRLNERNSTLAGELEEATIQLSKSVEEIHALQQENKSLALQLQEATKTRTTSRARSKTRLISGQANTSGEDGIA